jgi:hypothetical protein
MYLIAEHCRQGFPSIEAIAVELRSLHVGSLLSNILSHMYTAGNKFCVLKLPIVFYIIQQMKTNTSATLFHNENYITVTPILYFPFQYVYEFSTNKNFVVSGNLEYKYSKVAMTMPS